MKKKKGIHANTREGLRPLKPGEQIVYGGGGFHIVKKEKPKSRPKKGGRSRRTRKDTSMLGKALRGQAF